MAVPAVFGLIYAPIVMIGLHHMTNAIDPRYGAMEDFEELARQAIARTVDYFRSLGMPTCLTELGCGLQSEEELKELARRCTFYGARTIGAFRVLGEADILAIYRAANR